MCSNNLLSLFYIRKVPMLVVGNKADMAKKDRAVSKEEGKALADEFGAQFMEVSVSSSRYCSLHRPWACRFFSCFKYYHRANV